MDCKQRFWDTFATPVGCVCVWGSEARLTSGDHGEFGDATTTLMIHFKA